MISIITSTYNVNSAFLATANSIQSQNYKEFEWLVIDGGSDRSLLNIVESCSALFAYYKSEPDSGIYDAWNKALIAAKGDWIIFLGAGDIFIDEDVLGDVNNFIQQQNDHFLVIYGNVSIKSSAGFPRYINRKPVLDLRSFDPYCFPHHQGVFHSKRIYELYGYYDTTFKICADNKLLLSVYLNSKFIHFDRCISEVKEDGISSSSSSIITVFNEYLRIRRDLGMNNNVAFMATTYMFMLARMLLHKILPDKITNYIRSLLDGRRGSGL